jgi:uncharacterized membrane protein
MIKYFQTLNWQKLAKITIILIIAYFVFIFSICLYKYFTYQYNGLDLAIFNQVFYNTSLGKLFHFTIHPTSYLGDHFKPMILLLTPFYALYKSPIALLFLQTLFLALAAVPLYLISKKHLQPLHALLVIILYLFNPVTMNINLFEFHILPLAIFFIFWTFYFYDKNKFRPFLLFAFLTLLTREDVSFVVFMFGIIALLDRKKLKWILTPIISSAIYFFIALKVIAHFSASSASKFFVYYEWLGNTPLEIAENFFIKFPLVLQHFLNFAHFELILGFLLVFLFIPIYRPKYLLLVLGQFLEIILGFASGEAILRTHYAAPFIAALSIATIFSLKALGQNQKFLNFYKKNRDIFLIIIVITIIYNFLVLGPLITFINSLSTLDVGKIKLENDFAKQIPSDASLITSYGFISNLSSRQKLYSLNYVFLGRQQFNAGDYIVPNDTKYLLLDFDDFVGFHLQYGETIPKYYYEGSQNMRKLLVDKNFCLERINKNFALWGKNCENCDLFLYKIFTKEKPKIKNSQDVDLAESIKFLGWDRHDNITSLFFKPLKKMDKNYFIKLDNKTYLLGYGFYPTSEWQADEIVQINFYDLVQIKRAEIFTMNGGYHLDGIGSVFSAIDKVDKLGEFNLQ